MPHTSWAASQVGGDPAQVGSDPELARRGIARQHAQRGGITPKLLGIRGRDQDRIRFGSSDCLLLCIGSMRIDGALPIALSQQRCAIAAHSGTRCALAALPPQPNETQDSRDGSERRSRGKCETCALDRVEAAAIADLATLKPAAGGRHAKHVCSVPGTVPYAAITVVASRSLMPANMQASSTRYRSSSLEYHSAQCIDPTLSTSARAPNQPPEIWNAASRRLVAATNDLR